MKPTTDVARIKKLIDHHRQMEYLHKAESERHTDRVQLLNEYLYELQKPGFKLPNSWITMGTLKRQETTIITAGNTMQSDIEFELPKSKKK